MGKNDTRGKSIASKRLFFFLIEFDLILWTKRGIFFLAFFGHTFGKSKGFYFPPKEPFPTSLHRVSPGHIQINTLYNSVLWEVYVIWTNILRGEKATRKSCPKRASSFVIKMGVIRDRIDWSSVYMDKYVR
jgi:hypothetical protein